MAGFADLRRRVYAPRPLRYRGRWVDNWFSNFHPGTNPVLFSSLSFRSVEAAYVAAKCLDPEFRRRVSRMGPADAKRAGRPGNLIGLRPDWEEVCVAAMDLFLRQKFAAGTPELERLSGMGKPPVEANNWGDRRWGVGADDWRGKNALGVLLALIRDEFRRTGAVAPSAGEPDWARRQAELVPLMNRVGGDRR
jgi:predicted NAD-dependent protein-ADP-ribosyltransferase YbiA (DUF1768 family)